MNLLEHEAKSLLSQHEIPVPRSWLIRNPGDLPPGITYPVVAKSQVPVGGRGKAGGIVTVKAEADVSEVVKNVFALPIKGHTPSAVLVEELLDVDRELYLALRLNRDTRRIEWLVSPEGGVEIESHADSIQAFTLDVQDRIAAQLGVDTSTITPLLDLLVAAFTETDLLLLEINPLVVRSNGALICADAKILVDDNAKFRHTDLPWPDTTGNPPKPLGGSIGCIANGAGMAMSTMDTIVAAGGKPANFLDIGGGTGEEGFVTALSQIMDLPGVTSIIVNIFAGISRCDEIARGIIAAREQLPDLPPLFIRLEGTNRDIALQILEDAGITTETDLASCVKKAMEVTA